MRLLSFEHEFSLLLKTNSLLSSPLYLVAYKIFLQLNEKSFIGNKMILTDMAYVLYVTHKRNKGTSVFSIKTRKEII
jgi:hypothetical protein